MKVWSFIGAIFFAAACSAGSPSPVSGNGNSSPGMKFHVTAADLGSLALPCDRDVSGIVLFPDATLNLFCNENIGDNSSETLATISLANFHGSDTYTFTGSSDLHASNFNVTYDNHFYGVIATSPGWTATSCTIQLTAPAQPKKGDHVSGTFHCDNAFDTPVKGDGGYQPGKSVSLDAEFDGYLSM